MSLPRVRWTVHSQGCWIGRSSAWTWPRYIEYEPRYGTYHLDGSRVSYQTLRAAKIAAARTAADYEASGIYMEGAR